MHAIKVVLSLSIVFFTGSCLLADEEGQTFLDQATEAKLNAKNFQDLEGVDFIADLFSHNRLPLLH